MNAILFIDNTMVLVIRGLKDHNGAYVNDATVTATIMNGATEVYSGPGEYVAGSNGNYDVPLPSTLDVAVRDRLVATVEALSNGLRFQDQLFVTVQAR